MLNSFIEIIFSRFLSLFVNQDLETQHIHKNGAQNNDLFPHNKFAEHYHVIPSYVPLCQLACCS